MNSVKQYVNSEFVSFETRATGEKKKREEKNANAKLKHGSKSTLRVCLDRTYFAKTENLLLKSL